MLGVTDPALPNEHAGRWDKSAKGEANEATHVCNSTPRPWHSGNSPPAFWRSNQTLESFFDRFTAEWVRADPQLATSSQYFSGEEQAKLDAQLTPIGAKIIRERVERARRGLAELRRFDRKRLTASQRVSARVLEWQLDSIVRAERFSGHEYLFNQGIAGLPGTLVRFLTEIHPARNSRDVENYLARLAQLALRLDEAIVEARARAARGIAPPRFILTATIDQIERLAAPEPGRNVLVESFEQRIEKVASISADARHQFHSAAAKVVADSVVPSLRRVIALLDEQRKTATDEAGYSRLPEGTAAYAARLRNFTSTGLTADQIHQTGLEQVARIEGEMDKVLRQLNYLEGSVKERYQRAMDDYSYPDAPDVRTTILADYEKIIRDAEKRAGALFDLRPKASVVVRRIPEYQERNTSSQLHFAGAGRFQARGLQRFPGGSEIFTARYADRSPITKRFPDTTFRALFSRKTRNCPVSVPTESSGKARARSPRVGACMPKPWRSRAAGMTTIFPASWVRSRGSYGGHSGWLWIRVCTPKAGRGNRPSTMGSRSAKWNAMLLILAKLAPI